LRRTLKTIRRLKSKQARDLAFMANDLDTSSRRLHRLAGAIDTQVSIAQTLEDTHLVKLGGCDDHEKFDVTCQKCYDRWATTPPSEVR
jgi:hypothetical protein